MSHPLLLCTDLDRTLLPNGVQPESLRAPEYFARLAARPEVTLAYVSGRDPALVRQAMADFSLPAPDYVVADVGTSLYQVRGSAWQEVVAWQTSIATDWRGLDGAALLAWLGRLPGLTLQEPSRQGPYKLSFYAPPDLERSELLPTLRRRLHDAGLRVALVFSLDETTNTGLLDLVPEGATKLHAILFLADYLGMAPEACLFAGDSGNDLPVLASAVPAVLVANATAAVRQAALEQARAAGHVEALYLARGNFLGMNGNYSAGIVEGAVHYRPEVLAWLESG